MIVLARLRIGTKLFLLAGLPLLAALALATVVITYARQQAASAAALGSIEDVARLASNATHTLSAIQLERATTSLLLGCRARSPSEEGPTPDCNAFQRELASTRGETDSALAALRGLVRSYKLERLPARVGRVVDVANRLPTELDRYRGTVDAAQSDLDGTLQFFEPLALEIIGATAALAELSDDAPMLRSMNSLAALLDRSERASRIHAVLSYCFAAGNFPAGAFKTLVTLVTEEAAFAGGFQTQADERARVALLAALSDVASQADDLVRRTLASTDDELRIDPSVWFNAQLAKLKGLRQVESELLHRIKESSAAKLARLRTTERVVVGFTVSVLALSILFAALLSRIVARSISALAEAAARVRVTKNYALRAPKLSFDELGQLTDTFNEMLGGIEARDRELEHHREQLEKLVDARTEQLRRRNAQMRLVLDHVDQGLVTIDAQGGLSSERSAAFSRFFGDAPEGAPFAKLLAAGNEMMESLLSLGWSQVTEGFLPVDVALDQLPKRIVRNGSFFEVALRPMLDGEEVIAALLVCNEVTHEVAAAEERERQREYIGVFERFMRDREGFREFVTETGAMVEALPSVRDPALAFRVMHTIKGNTSLYEVHSVARIAHELESLIAGDSALPEAAQIARLVQAWKAFTGRVQSLMGGAQRRVEISRQDLDVLIEKTRKRVPHEQLLTALESLRHEPVRVRFERMAEAMRALAKRLGKPTPEVRIEGDDLRLPASRFAGFWASAVHLQRNLVDHGIESAEERKKMGKPEHGTILLRAELREQDIVLTFADDGPGIAWEKVAVAARMRGIAAGNRADLERALFHDGLSTAKEVSDISGRGVGLSAILEQTRALHGRIAVQSEPGRGARFQFIFPRAGNEHSLPPPA